MSNYMCDRCGMPTLHMHTHLDQEGGWYCEYCCTLCDHVCTCDTGCDGTCMDDCHLKPKTACGKSEMCDDCAANGGCGEDCK